MHFFKRFFDFYIQASIHVSLAVSALVLMTYLMFDQQFDVNIIGFVFFGTLAGYNFVKYQSFFRVTLLIQKQLKGILGISVVASLGALYFFFNLKLKTQFLTLLFFGVTVLYTIPVFSNTVNIRNWSGVKIYIVAFCWAGVTILLPMVNLDTELYQDLFIKFLQRFLLVIILILIFEIIDLSNDDPRLKTVPQKLGVKKTKYLGFFLLIPFYFLEFFKSNTKDSQLIVNVILVLGTGLFLHFANENRSRYYTTFWVESIPIFWLGLLFLFEFWMN